MSEAFVYYFCRNCQRERLTANPVPPVKEFFHWATLALLPASLAVLRHFALPVRCTVCFGPLRSSFQGHQPISLPQLSAEIDSRLSIFDSLTRRYSDSTIEFVSRDRVHSLVIDDRGYMDTLKTEGFAVGGRHERILHVARIQPEYLLQGYVGKFFFLLFLPITWLNFWYRRSRNPRSHFFPLDYHRAGRVILTDKRLAIYYHMSTFYYVHCSIPYEAILEIRQYQSSIRLQVKSGARRTVTVRLGREIGTLLRAIQELTKLPVRERARSS